MNIKTHTFKLGKYSIEFVDDICGVCDMPGEAEYPYEMLIQDNGNAFETFQNALHEAEHADGVPVSVTHGVGNDDTERRAKFLWRVAKMLLMSRTTGANKE